MTQMSEKQHNFINNLLVERNLPFDYITEQFDIEHDEFSSSPPAVLMSEARQIIEHLLQLPKPKREPQPRFDPSAVPDGFHLLPGEAPASAEDDTGRDIIYKVQTSPQTGNKYAKYLRLPDPALGEQKGEWVYAGQRPLRYLSEDTLLTKEKAVRFGHLYGVCARCGRTLTNEGSIEAGIGPVCAGKMGW